MASEGESDYKTVRGLTRGLTLLNTLNRLGGGASPTPLARIKIIFP